MNQKLSVPYIDIGPLLDPKASLKDLLPISETLIQSFRGLGFARIEGHGIPSSKIQSLLSSAKAFFQLSFEEKTQIHMQHAGQRWRGFAPLGMELTAGKEDQKEALYFGREATHSSIPMHGPNQWPQRPTELRHQVMDYMEQMEKLGSALMKGFALGLGLDPNYFKQCFNEPLILFRVFNYPAHKKGEHLWGVGEHTDMGFLTILYQDQSGGLQAKTLEGEWIDIPPDSNQFVINIGDMLEYWTHGIVRATPHRVRNLGQGDRLSLPFFFDPSWKAPLSRIPRSLIHKNLSPLPHLSERWDGLNLNSLPQDMSYGDYVWNKVRRVFPNLLKSSL